MKRVNKKIWVKGGLWTMLIWGLAMNVQAGMVEYTSGHADIGLALEAPNTLFLHYHFGIGSAILDGLPATAANEELGPAEAYTRVPDSAIITLPVAVDFLGTSANDSVWILPQASSSGLPFLGVATEELDGLGFTSAGFRLTGFTGPLGGNMAVFQTPAFGPPVVYFRSNDGIDPLVDLVPSAIGSHDHYNYGFSQAGVYDLTIEGFATRPAGTLTDSGVFRFVVGDSTAVPEPSSLMTMVVCLSCIGFLPRSRLR